MQAPGGMQATVTMQTTVSTQASGGVQVHGGSGDDFELRAAPEDKTPDAANAPFDKVAFGGMTMNALLDDVQSKVRQVFICSFFRR